MNRRFSLAAYRTQMLALIVPSLRNPAKRESLAPRDASGFLKRIAPPAI
jgi:hypothetical protein